MLFFKYLFPYLRKYKKDFIFGIISLICVNVVQLFIPQIIKLAIDGIVLHNLTKFSLIKYVFLVIGIGILMVIFRYFWRYYIYSVGRKVEFDLKNKLFFHLQNLGNKFYLKYNKIGDIMAHITNDCEQIVDSIIFGTIAITDAIVLGSLSIIFLLLISPSLTLYAFAPLPLLCYITLKFGKIIYKKYKSAREAFSLLTGFVRERFDGIRIIKAYNCEDSEARKFANHAQEYMNKNMDLIKVRGSFSPIVFCFAYFSICIVMWFGGKSVILNSISIGSFVAFQMYLGGLVWPIIAIGMVINSLENGAVSFSRINKLLEIPPEIKDTGEKNIKEIEGNIEFVNVHFSYNGKEILKNINLRIKVGESIGIVGKVGSGKTTLLSLLPRLLEPTNGKILIDNYSIEKIPLSVLRKNIGFVPQENFLFSTTIKENIKFGNPSASDEAIKEVARLVYIDDEIEEFDKKYDEVVGERGITLSGGQAQRISIARALLNNPKILILDNALSNVDAEKAGKILKRLREIFIDKIIIVATHRIRSIKDFDRIIVLDEGKIVEEGNHNELLKNKGIYYNLFMLEEFT